MIHVPLSCVCYRNPTSAGLSVATSSSASLSMSLDSQPPGPSGIDLRQFPAVPTLSSVDEITEPSLGNEGRVVPLGVGAREEGMPRTEMQAASLMFQVPPSQDVLSHGATQENLGFNNEGTSLGKMCKLSIPT